MNITMKNRLKIAAVCLIALLILLIGGFRIYTLNYYRADANVLQMLADDVTNGECQVKGNMMIFLPETNADKGTGLIFYPGGKVEAEAYVPLLSKLAQEGITCVLIKMPFNLAVFDINAAEQVYLELPNMSSWYIGGHSLGGAMASSYANKKADKVKGLVLLGAYPVGTADIPILAIYGSEDKVLDKSKLEGTSNVLEIKGGNHANFGNYGEQKGDGKSSITARQQQDQAVQAIIRFITEEPLM